MNILHLEASKGWGGQEMRILKEAEGMRERGHLVILAVMRGGSLVKMARSLGFIVYELNFKKPFWIFCLASLIRIVLLHRIDLINTHSSLDGWIGGIAARISRRFVVRTRHLSTPIKPGLNSKIVYGKLADFVVTTCESVVPMIAKQSGKPLSKLRSIATGVDPRKIVIDSDTGKKFRESIGFGQNVFLVGTVCVMRSWKGINVLLESADKLRHIPDLRWVIIGGGHAEVHHRRAKELQLDGIVHFTGHLDNPFPGLNSLDVFTLLSTANEGVSQAILQAAYLGKPLIATETGGLKEVCIDLETGISVPVFDAEAVARAVLKLKEDALLREGLGSRARQLVIDRFLLNKTLDHMEEVYTNLSYTRSTS